MCLSMELSLRPHTKLSKRDPSPICLSEPNEDDTFLTTTAQSPVRNSHRTICDPRLTMSQALPFCLGSATLMAQLRRKPACAPRGDGRGVLTMQTPAFGQLPLAPFLSLHQSPPRCPFTQASRLASACPALPGKSNHTSHKCCHTTSIFLWRLWSQLPDPPEHHGTNVLGLIW